MGMMTSRKSSAPLVSTIFQLRVRKVEFTRSMLHFTSYSFGEEGLTSLERLRGYLYDTIRYLSATFGAHVGSEDL